ncbi:MAG: nucleotidyltransferase domain-containing protein [Candidatus Cloacimonadales bacterium]|nr:nucleotidyltransferase domain-containing protein [Candidatus Cloacimonadales bacterium]
MKYEKGMINMNNEKRLDFAGLKEFLMTNYPEIELCYVFGSAKNGFVKKDSDLDLGLLFKSGFSKTLALQISSELEEKLGCPVDIVVLNSANPILLHEVLGNGVRLYEKNSYDRALFELNSFRMFVDSTYFLRRRYA